MYNQGFLLAAAAVSLATPSRWIAIIEPKAGSQLHGTATVESVSPDSIRATVQVTGAAPGSVFRWHMHHGTCSALGEIAGKAEQYPTITADKDGIASTTVVLAVSPPVAGDYVVNVHKSSTDMTSVACGTLKPAEAPLPSKGNPDAPPAPSSSQPPKPAPY